MKRDPEGVFQPCAADGCEREGTMRFADALVCGRHFLNGTGKGKPSGILDHDPGANKIRDPKNPNVTVVRPARPREDGLPPVRTCEQPGCDEPVSDVPAERYCRTGDHGTIARERDRIEACGKGCRHEKAWHFAMQYFSGDTTDDVQRALTHRYREALRRMAKHERA